MAVVVEGDQFVGIANPEHEAGAEHQQADPEDTREQRHQEPVAEVGDELALAPPGLAGIAGPEMRQHREHQRQRDVTGTTLAMVWPSISTISVGRFICTAYQKPGAPASSRSEA